MDGMDEVDGAKIGDRSMSSMMSKPSINRPFFLLVASPRERSNGALLWGVYKRILI